MVKTRQPALPHVPTVAEFVPGYEANFWTGIAAPKGSPAEVVDKVNKAVNAGFADPDVKARLDDGARPPCPVRPPISQNSSPMKPRKIGQGHPHRQHQGGVRHLPSVRPSTNSDRRTLIRSGAALLVMCGQRPKYT
jgi:hypothetical protein